MCEFNPACYDLFGIGHPVLGFGPSALVSSFAEALVRGRGRVFIFKSAADNHPINNTASEELIRIVEAKGYDVFHDFLYLMPCNWFINYQRPFNLQIVDKAKIKALQHAKELTAGTNSRLRPCRRWRWIARILHRLESRYGRKQFGRALQTTTNCTLCGRCIKDCPVQNIREENHRIRFGNNCLWCMRCIYSCPETAIDARWMNWCVVKGGYRLSEYARAPDVDRTFVTRGSRGYWKHFRQYFE
ncbi:MAG: hypothetical protein HN368_16235 [Spirochaetales bacterium]|nr:hypothetical protein [Spirochaetales bacterium]